MRLRAHRDCCAWVGSGNTCVLYRAAIGCYCAVVRVRLAWVSKYSRTGETALDKVSLCLSLVSEP